MMLERCFHDAGLFLHSKLHAVRLYWCHILFILEAITNDLSQPLSQIFESHAKYLRIPGRRKSLRRINVDWQMDILGYCMYFILSAVGILGIIITRDSL